MVCLLRKQHIKYWSAQHGNNKFYISIQQMYVADRQQESANDCITTTIVNS